MRQLSFQQSMVIWSCIYTRSHDHQNLPTGSGGVAARPPQEVSLELQWSYLSTSGWWCNAYTRTCIKLVPSLTDGRMDVVDH